MPKKTKPEIQVFNQLVNFIPYFLFWKDLDHRYMGCNDIFARSAGFEKASDMIGLNDYDCCWTKEESDFFRTVDKKVMEENKPILNVEEPQRQLDGTTITLLTSKVPLHDNNGNVIGILGMYTDITENKRQEQQQYELKVFLETVLEAMPHMIFVKDAKDLRFKLLNRAGEKLLGKDRQDLIGKNDYDFFPEDQAAFFQEKDYQVIRNKQPVTIAEEPIETPLGTKILKTTKIPVLNKKGQPDYLLGIAEDITERKLLEKQAHHTSKLASIGELAAGVGHEINNPLMVIEGQLYNLRRKFKNKESFDQAVFEKTMSKIEKAATRIEKIVRGLRTFSRQDSEDLKAFSPKEILIETIDLVKEIFIREGVEIHVSPIPGESDCLVYGNPGRLQQVLINLLSNARDATSKKNDRLVKVNVTTSKSEVRISVSDNGCGISAKDKENIFEPFYTTKEAGVGTGIGLSIAQNIMHDHGGRLELETQEGNGSVFTMALPLYTAGGEVDTSNKPSTYTVPTGLSVLVVDDEQSNRDVMRIYLESLNCTVTDARDGKEGLNIYSQNPNGFDIIISDVKMPVMDGVSFAKTLRQNTSLPQPHFIIVTGGTTIDFQSKDNDLNELIDGYMFKPFRREEVKKIISEIMGTKGRAA